MGRVIQGLSLNIVLNARNLPYRIKLVRSSNYILRITRHAIAWLYPSWTSASRRSKNSWIGDSFDRLCVRGEHRFDLLRRRIVLRDYVQTSGCRKRLRTSIIFQGSTIRPTSLKMLQCSRILVIIYRDLTILESEKKLYQKGASVRTMANLKSFGRAFGINQSTFGIHLVYEPRIS